MIDNLLEKLNEEDLIPWRYIPLSRKLIENNYSPSSIIVYGRLLTYQSNGSKYSTYNNTNIANQCNIKKQNINNILTTLANENLIKIKIENNIRKIYAIDNTQDKGFIKCYNKLFSIKNLTNTAILLYSYYLEISKLKNNKVFELNPSTIIDSIKITKPTIISNNLILEKCKLINQDSINKKIAIEILQDVSIKE